MGTHTVPSSFPDPEPLIQHPAALRLGLLVCASIMAALAVLPAVLLQINVWRFDALRSLGALFPFIALFLIARAWTFLDWKLAPSPTGFILLAAGVVLGNLTVTTSLAVRLSPHAVIELVQPALAFTLAIAGVLLLLGGWKLLRASLFPLALLLLVDVVPHSFNTLIDLPLQHLSANVARGFAHLLGMTPTGDELTMLYAPHFGMMIVPGCNGMRGAVTMGYLALLLAYLRNFNLLKSVLCVLGAVALGYAMNLARLCLLTLYYRIALHHTALQGNGAAVDYVIGAIIFFTCTAAFAAVFSGETHLFPGTRPPRLAKLPTLPAVTLALLAVAAVAQTIATIHRPATTQQRVAVSTALAALPQSIGPWQRTRTWTEADRSAPDAWQWAEYRHDNERIHLGLYLTPLVHHEIDSEISHGRYPAWSAPLYAHDSAGHAITFFTFVAADPDRVQQPTYSAETDCYSDACIFQAAGFQSRGFAFRHRRDAGGQRLPILIQLPGVDDRELAEKIVYDLTSHLDTAAITNAAGLRL